MKRADLEHLIRAVISITNAYDVMIIGSQSILGTITNPPDELVVSMEADMYLIENPEDSILIDGSIGEGSLFHNRFGYYAEGVGPNTAILPNGWQQRVIKIQNENTNNKIGYCLDICDLAVSKLVAGRDKDWPFVEIMLKHELIHADILRDRILTTPIVDTRKTFLINWVNSHAGNAPADTGESFGI